MKDGSYDALSATERAGPSPGDVALGATFGRFVMREVLGRGAMGVVIEAYDPDLDRRVALKLLRPGGDDDAARQRLHLEAQAMARLAHPNVVTVFEVGRSADQLFIAMELVEGTTLKDWLRTPRGWRDTAAAFAAAGRGLEAAHDAGLTHRDFKPENVLIGRDGRPRVADFGLASVGRAGTGESAGTPAYMSPEQWTSEAVDARSDQFAFCAALWRSVYGEGPFPDHALEVLRMSVIAGELRDPPPGAKAPRWLHRALARGLARDPAARWPSLGALLDALDDRLAMRRRTAWIAAGASVVAAGAVVVAAIVSARGAAEPCAPPVGRAAAVWGPAHRASIQHHLLDVDRALGGTRFAAVAAVLDRTVPSWVDASVGACRATRVEGRQSDTLLDLRMRCLDEWLGRAADLTDELGAVTGPAQLDGAVAGIGRLGLVERCANTALLQAVAPPPIEPDLAAEVRAIEAELSAIRTLQRRSSPVPELAARAEAALARARRVGHPPIVADALALRAQLAETLGDASAAIALLREIPVVAARAHDDERAAKTWSVLVRMLAEHRAKPGEAVALIPAAEAASARIGDPPLVLAQVLADESHGLAAAGDTEGAVRAALRARGLLEGAGATKPGSPAGPQLVGILHSLGSAYMFAGQGERAIEALRQAIARADAIYGPDTIYSAAAYLTLGEVLRDQNELAEAEHALREAVRIREARTGSSRALAIAMSSLADTISQRGRPAEAIPIVERALAIGRATLASEPALLATIIAPAADIYSDAKRLPEAIALYDEVHAIVARERMVTLNVAAWSINRGDLLRRTDRCPDALRDFDRAVAVAIGLEGPRSRMAGSALRSIGYCLHTLKRDGEAVAAFERALAYDVLPYQARDAARARGMLGQLLIATGRDRARGAELVRLAEAKLRELGAKRADDFAADAE